MRIRRWPSSRALRRHWPFWPPTEPRDHDPGPKRSLTDDDLKELAETPLIITIVRHTDTGKDVDRADPERRRRVQEVSPVPSTTRKAAGQSYKLGVRDLVTHLRYTWIRAGRADTQEVRPSGSAVPGTRWTRFAVARRSRCIGSSAYVLDQVVKSDVLLYVTNIAIEPQREAERCELAILTRAGQARHPCPEFPQQRPGAASGVGGVLPEKRPPACLKLRRSRPRSFI